MVHNPGYDFNDDNIAQGSAFWVMLVAAASLITGWRERAIAWRQANGGDQPE
jgi:hypothetical protein